MAEIEKFMNVSVGDIEKIMNISKGDIEKVMGLEIPAGTPAWQGTRCIAMGREVRYGTTTRYVQMIYRTMSTSGSDAGDLGDLDAFDGDGRGKGPATASSNNVYAVYWTGYETTSGTLADQGEVITMATGADAVFGTTGFDNAERHSAAGVCNGTQGHIAGGNDGSSYVASSYKLTVGTSGSATSSGDLTTARIGPTGISHETYGYYCGGYQSASPAGYLNKIEKITINSDSNASDQGDLTIGVYVGASSEDASRGIMYSGYGSGGYKEDISYFATATGGNATDFGDKDKSQVYCGAAGNGTHCEFWAGQNDDAPGASENSGYVTAIFYVTVQSTGDAQDTGAIVDWDSQDGAGTGGRFTTLASGVQ